MAAQLDESNPITQNLVIYRWEKAEVIKPPKLPNFYATISGSSALHHVSDEYSQSTLREKDPESVPTGVSPSCWWLVAVRV